MKQIFFYFCGGLLVFGLGGWLLYLVGEAFAQLFRDWRLGRELDVLAQESAARREQKRQANEQRLATGCQHDFTGTVAGFPLGACPKCGMEREKPTGGCDHLWRLKSGAVPTSYCEKCQKTYSPLEVATLPGRK